MFEFLFSQILYVCGGLCALDLPCGQVGTLFAVSSCWSSIGTTRNLSTSACVQAIGVPTLRTQFFCKNKCVHLNTYWVLTYRTWKRPLSLIGTAHLHSLPLEDLREGLCRVSESTLYAASSSSLSSFVTAHEDFGYGPLHDFVELPIQTYSPALTQFATFGTAILL